MASTQHVIRDLTPSYFALVMATGILSVATHLLGQEEISRLLLAAGLAFYAVLTVLTAWRALRYSAHVAADLNDPGVMFGFFTFVAGTDVLGTRLVLGGHARVAIGCLALGLVSWTILTYYTMAVLIFRNKRPFDQVVNGGWLTLIVATQSICVLGVSLAHTGWLPIEPALLLTFGFWAGGCFLYALFITFIMLRLCFRWVEPGGIEPAYWINMGALAISTVAGTMLIAVASSVDFAQGWPSFILAATAALWCAATWWLPLLAGMGFWKHVRNGIPLRYEPALWSMVFPLGMYSVATAELGAQLGLDVLDVLAPAFMWIALAAWTATFLGLVLRTRTVVRAKLKSQPPEVTS